MTMAVVPMKNIIKHRKIFLAGFTAAFLLTVSSIKRHDAPGIKHIWGIWHTQTSNMHTRTGLLDQFHQFQMKTDFNWSNILSAESKPSKSPHTCLFPDSKNITGINYLPNMEKTGLKGAEDEVFGSLSEKVRALTKTADVYLKYVQTHNYVIKSERESDMRAGLEARMRDGLAGAHRLRVDIGTYMYFPGGHWIPKTCTPKWKVAIVIPFRDRFVNLHILLRNLINFLKSQDLEFGIFVAEQGSSEVMNRGLMRNVGFHMAQKSGTVWDCYIFHDVDYVPVNITNYYGCDGFPRHFASKLEEFNYSNPFIRDFGGVVGLTEDQMERVNGYSNMYWGWGGEDDDLLYRIQHFKYNISRPEDGFYRNLHHKKSQRNESCRERFCLLKYGRYRMRHDGVSFLQYPIDTEISLSALYTNISVDVSKGDWNYGYHLCFKTDAFLNKLLKIFLLAIVSIILTVLIFVCLIHKYCKHIL